MKIRHKSILVRAAAMFELYDELAMLDSRHETSAVKAERAEIVARLLEYKLELVETVRELVPELSWTELERMLIDYATKGTHGSEVERREQWLRTKALPLVATIVAVQDYFEGMETVKSVRVATRREGVDETWDLVVRFVSGHEYGVVVRRGSNEMRLKGKTVWFGVPFRYVEGLKVRKEYVAELDQRFFVEIEGVRRVRS